MGTPKTDEERKLAHEKEFGTDELPPRGTGLRSKQRIIYSSGIGQEVFFVKEQQMPMPTRPAGPGLKWNWTGKGWDKVKAQVPAKKQPDAPKHKPTPQQGEGKSVPNEKRVTHPRFGSGKITNIDNNTYSVPMATFLSDNGDEIVRPLGEFKNNEQAPAGKKQEPQQGNNETNEGKLTNGPNNDLIGYTYYRKDADTEKGDTEYITFPTQQDASQKGYGEPQQGEDKYNMDELEKKYGGQNQGDLRAIQTTDPEIDYYLLKKKGYTDDEVKNIQNRDR